MDSSFVFQPNLVYGLGAVIIVSLISLVGAGLFFISKEKSAKVIPYLVSLAIGALLGDAILHLLPEAFEGAGSIRLFIVAVLAGFGIFYLLENVLHWHHSHDGDEKHHGHGQHIGAMITVADGLHNLIDGVIIALGFLISREVGLATTIAVILHEIPQEISDMGLLIYAGWSRKKALIVNFLSGCTAIVGFLAVFLLDAHSFKIESWLPYLLALAAGGFIYVAVIDLIPNLHAKSHRGHAHGCDDDGHPHGAEGKGSFWRHVPMMVLGFGIMALLLVLE